MSEIPSSLGVFLYAMIAFVVFSGIPLAKYLIKKYNKSKED